MKPVPVDRVFDIDWFAKPEMVGYLANGVFELIDQHIGFHGIGQCSAWDNLVRIAGNHMVKDHIAGAFGVIKLQGHLRISAKIVVLVDIVPESLYCLGRIPFVAHAAVGLGTRLAIF